MSHLIRISIILKLYNQIFVYYCYSGVPYAISYDRFFSGKYLFFGKLWKIYLHVMQKGKDKIEKAMLHLAEIIT